jgi:hypothetical protein
MILHSPGRAHMATLTWQAHLGRLSDQSLLSTVPEDSAWPQEQLREAERALAQAPACHGSCSKAPPFSEPQSPHGGVMRPTPPREYGIKETWEGIQMTGGPSPSSAALTRSCMGEAGLESSSVPQGDVSPVDTRLTAISACPLPWGPFMRTNSMLLYL